jgi:hypothetical protein
MPSNLINGPTLQLNSTAAIGAGLIVKLDTTSAAEALEGTLCGAGEAAIGISTNEATASGEAVNVAVLGSQVRVTAMGNSANIAVGDPLKSDASGKAVKASTGENIVALALDPATADNLLIRCIVIAPNSAVSAAATLALTVSTTSGTVTAAQINAAVHTFVNTTNASATALAIPGAASVPNGRILTVKRTGGANAVTITPAAGTIAGGASYASLDAVGDVATFVALGTDWVLSVRTIA